MSKRGSKEWRAKVSKGLKGRRLSMTHRVHISEGVRANLKLGRYVRTDQIRARSSWSHQLAAFRKQPAPTSRPSTLDIAWAAGVYEGEGTCGMGGGGKGFCLSVSQKDPELLYRLRRLFGGSITGPTEGGCHRWILGGIRGRGFAMTIFTFLTTRRRQQTLRALGSDETAAGGNVMRMLSSL